MRMKRWMLWIWLGALVAGLHGQTVPEAWLQENFGKKLVKTNGKTVPVSTTLGHKQIIGIYFSAHWCGPCRAFTPKLVEFRRECAKKNYSFEVVFVSLDKTEEDMAGYMKEASVPWPAVSFTAKERKALQENYGIRGVPTLVILDQTGRVITKNGRMDVVNGGVKAYSRWLAPDYKPLTNQDRQKKAAPKTRKGRQK